MNGSGVSGGGPSLALLLRHELRLWYRRSLEARSRRRLYLALFLVALAMLHALAYAIVRALAYLPADLSPALVLPLLTVAAAMLFTLVTAQALSGATRAFFETGTDVLMSAPISPGRLFSIRAVALALTTTAPFAIFVLPVAHVGLVLGGWRWMSLYPVLLAMGAVGTAAGLALALQLVRLVGARLSRSAGQIVAVLIGTSVGFAIQHFNRLSMEDKLAVVETVTRSSAERVDGLAVLAWTPGLALSGDPLAVAVLLVASLGLFALTIRLTASRYVRARQDAAGLAERPSGTRRRRRSFTTGPGASLRRKELRLLVRDPWILMPVLQRAIALVPVCLMLSGFQPEADAAVMVACPMLVVFAGKLSGGISWLTLAAEEAPELVNSAPVARTAVRRAKLEAALIAAGLLFAVPLAAVAWRSPEAAAWTALGCVAATLASTVLALAEPTAGQRRTLNERFRNSVPFVVAELLATMALAVAVWLAVGHRFAAAGLLGLVALAVLLGFVALMRPPERRPAPAPQGASPAPQALRRNPS